MAGDVDEENRGNCIYLEKWFRVFYRDLTAAQGAALELDALVVVDPSSLLGSPNLEPVRPLMVQVEEKPRIGTEGLLDAYKSLSTYPGGHAFVLLGEGVEFQAAKNALGGLSGFQLPSITVGPPLSQRIRVPLLDKKYGELANLLKLFLLNSACELSVEAVERMLAWADLRTLPRIRFLISLLRSTPLREFRKELHELIKAMSLEVREELSLIETRVNLDLREKAPQVLFAFVGIVKPIRLVERFWGPAAAEFISSRGYDQVFVIHSGDVRSEKSANQLGSALAEGLRRMESGVKVLTYGPGARVSGHGPEPYLDAMNRVLEEFGDVRSHPADLAFVGELGKPTVLKVVGDLLSRGCLELEGGGWCVKVANLFCGVHRILCVEREGGEEFLEHGFAFERVWPDDQA